VLPTLIGVTSGTTQVGVPIGAASPTSEELSDGIAVLAAEISDTFAGGRWAILDTATDQVKWRLYDGAALRHCCQLLQEMDLASRTGQEFSVRMLQRAHIEAWLTGLYIHYGGFAAVTRVAEDTLHHLQAAGNEADAIDQWLAGERRTARKRARKVQQANDGIRKWNEANPGLPAKPLHTAPHIPQLRPTGLDLSDRIADFSGIQARPLPVSELVDMLTKLAKEKNFGNETFRPIYLIYRVLSGIGTHPTLNILESYLTPGGFIRVAPAPVNGSIADSARITALYATAFLACGVLGDHECPVPAAAELCARFAPDPSGGSAWASGT
jgi:hypothetical protein